MKAHRTDTVSFAFGLIFLGFSAWWLLAQLLGLALPPVGWFLAGALILIGVLGLVGALRSGRSARTGTADTAVASPADAEPGSTLPAPVGGDLDRADVDPTRWDTERATSDADPTRWGADPLVAGAEPTARDLPDAGRPAWETARPAPDDDPAAWADGRSEWEVSAPMSGGPTSPGRTREVDEADEWPTEAVTDRPVRAVEDRVADEGGWREKSSSAPTAEPPTTQERRGG